MIKVFVFFITLFMLSVLSLYSTAAIIIGYALFIFPGFLLQIAPVIFAYTFPSYLLAELSLWFTGDSGRKHAARSYFLSFLAVVGTGCVIALIPSLPIWKLDKEMRNANIALKETISLPNVLAQFSYNNIGGYQNGERSECDDFCRRLLYNKAVKQVIVVPISQPALKLSNDEQYSAFSLEQREHCTDAGVAIRADNLSQDVIKMRVRHGECIIKSKATLKEAGLIFARVIKNQEHETTLLFDNRTYLDQISLLKKTDHGYETIYRFSNVHASPLVVPLMYMNQFSMSGGNISKERGFLRYSIGYVPGSNFRPDILFEGFPQIQAFFGKAISPIAQPTNDEIKLRLVKALDQPEERRGEKEALFMEYLNFLFKDFYTHRNLLGEDDVVLISKAIIDSEIKDFWGLDHVIHFGKTKRPSLLGLRDLLISRLNNASTREETLSFTKALSSFSLSELTDYKEKIQITTFDAQKITWIKDKVDPMYFQALFVQDNKR